VCLEELLMAQKQASKRKSKATTDPDDWDDIAAINPECIKLFRNVLLKNSELELAIAYSAARLFRLVHRHHNSKDVRDTVKWRFGRPPNPDEEPTLGVAKFSNNLALMYGSKPSSFIAVLWRGKPVLFFDISKYETSSRLGPWVQTLASTLHDLAIKLGEEPGDLIELLNLEAERWDYIERCCSTDRCGMNLEPAGFRLEWHESGQSGKHHRADYNNLAEAEAARARMKRMGVVTGSIQTIINKRQQTPN